jgi:uncharacterized protein YdiU (UPF0061 family)
LPVPLSDPKLVAVNHALADHLDIDPVWFESEEGVNVIAGNQLVDGAGLIATVYDGNQFGHWTPRLGDGRAVLLGEVIAKHGHGYDIQLKESGLTRIHYRVLQPDLTNRLCV